MRDLLITLIVFGSVPVTLVKPQVGVLVWSWLGYMNPHRLSWGFAYDFPFAAVVAVATLIGLLFTRESKRLPVTPLTVVWLVFTLWMSFTTLFAIFPDQAVKEWSRAMKIMLISFVTVMVMRRRDRLQLLIWVIVVSIGFYGFKGGFFTLLNPTGGRQLVYGPPESFFGDNTSLALVLVMTLPLMHYLRLSTNNLWIKRGLVAVMLLTVVSIVGSHSRGALLAFVAMGLFLWLKSPKRLATGTVMAIMAVVALAAAPEQWFERMQTISTYQQDNSALGRINAWWMAFNLANDRPVVGGGFDAFDKETFARYAPEPHNVHDAHSIYFEVLAEHGYVGLALFLALGWLALRSGNWVRRTTRDRPDLKWARDLAGMMQVSLVGYAVGGAFLGLAYFDLYYSLIAMIVITHFLVNEELKRGREAENVREKQPDRMHD